MGLEKPPTSFPSVWDMFLSPQEPVICLSSAFPKLTISASLLLLSDSPLLWAQHGGALSLRLPLWDAWGT